VLTLSGNASVPYGTNVTVGASITIPAPGNLVSAALGGTITFKLDNAAIASCPAITVTAGNLGPYTCTLVATPVGAHTVTATYSGNANYGGVTNAPLTGGVTITKLTLPSFDLSVIATTRAFSQTAAPAGTPVAGTLFAQIQLTGGLTAGLFNPATDTIQFQIDGTNFGAPIVLANAGNPVSLTDSAATAVGTHTITAIFSGDSNINGITNTTTETVTQAPTSTALAFQSGGPNYAVGTSIVVTATVSTVAPAVAGALSGASSAGSPILGFVSFYLDGAGTPFATVFVTSNGTTSAPLPAGTAVGLHSVTAVYTGTATYATSTSAALNPNIQAVGTTTTVTSATNPSTYGNPVTFTVTVAPTAANANKPSGTVLLQVNGGLPGFTGILATSGNNGVVAITVPGSALPVASSTSPITIGGVSFNSDAISVTYSGDTNFGSSSGSLAGGQTVNANTVTTTIVITPPATTNLVYGQPVQLPAAVTSNPPSTLTPPTGNVTYSDTYGVNPVTALALPGKSTFSDTITPVYITNSLIVGIHRIIATYSPPQPQTGNVFVGSTSNTVTLTVAKAATTITVTPTNNTNGNFTALVTVNAPGAGIPTGTVEFLLNGTQAFGYAPLLTVSSSNFTNGGQFIATWQGGPVNGVVTAIYSGDLNFAGSTSTGLPMSAPSLNISGVSISTSVDPATVGQPITYTATVTGSKGIATGSVQFLADGNLMGSGNLNTVGVATFTTSSLSAGSHTIVASYGGDDNYAPSVSAGYGQQVQKLVSTVSVSSNVAAPILGQAIVFTVQLGPTPGAGYAAQTGTVTLFDTSTQIASVTASAPVTTITISSLFAGTHQIIAKYSGDGIWYPANSTAFVQIVGRAATTTTLTSAPAPASSQIILTATVTASQGIPTGTVNFVDPTNQNVVASATLVNGTATTMVKPGDPSLVAVYSGDSNFLPSSSSNGFNELKAENAASFATATFAPNEIVSLFGSSLSVTTASATPPLSTTLGGTTIGVTDMNGNFYQAKIYYASPAQVNFVMPAILAPGPGVIAITTTAGANFTLNITIAATSPGLFSAGGNGQGVAAAVLYDQPPTGGPATSFTANCNTSPCTAIPIVLNSTDQFYLGLYGTGISNAAQGQVSATVNGINVPVSGVAAQSQFPGLDQVNIGPLPLSLQGSGSVNVVLTVNGSAANTVTVTFK
jgi:uncharacterized protein (TIGR03437 family)